MKKLMKISTVSTLLLLMAFVGAQAQKFGHLNSGNLLVQMQETKVADDSLKVFQDSLVKVGQERAKKLQEDFNLFAQAYQQGSVPPVEAQKKQAEFQQKQEELSQFEDEVMQMVAKKREELIAPILERVQEAINEIGKNEGYTMIFDTSVFNTILFAQDSDDIEAKVKAKLGLE
ncbi:MAG: OmpH family outer membrane protein [Lewinellaceae bacterium]|nr:OmpH family outer membrane protein [Saprospiraceae bacterium]MCB9338654.1 OmpH family outer membrane protein [Lewinellaceae bacterium]